MINKIEEKTEQGVNQSNKTEVIELYEVWDVPLIVPVLHKDFTKGYLTTVHQLPSNIYESDNK